MTKPEEEQEETAKEEQGEDEEEEEYSEEYYQIWLDHLPPIDFSQVDDFDSDSEGEKEEKRHDDREEWQVPAYQYPHPKDPDLLTDTFSPKKLFLR